MIKAIRALAYPKLSSPSAASSLSNYATHKLGANIPIFVVLPFCRQLEQQGMQLLNGSEWLATNHYCGWIPWVDWIQKWTSEHVLKIKTSSLTAHMIIIKRFCLFEFQLTIDRGIIVRILALQNVELRRQQCSSTRSKICNLSPCTRELLQDGTNSVISVYRFLARDSENRAYIAPESYIRGDRSSSNT